jgi:hypothetical protein
MNRRRPSDRRAHEIIAIEHDGHGYKVGLGREVISIGNVIEMETRRRDGRLGEIVEVFLNAEQVNSQMDVLASDGAILMSLLIQYGCPPADIHHAMKRNADGSPASPLGRAAAFLVEGSS